MKELFSSPMPEDMEPIVTVLQAHAIPFEIQTHRNDFVPNFTFERPVDAVKLMVSEADFEKANALLIDFGLLEDVSTDDGYREMLGGLDVEDLMEIAVNYREYPIDQVEMAKKLLAERGIALPKEKIEQERAAMRSAQHKPIQIKLFGMILWILFSFIGAPIGTVFSIVVLTLKGKDIDGKAYPIYDERAKRIAKVLLVISLSISIALFIMNYAVQN
jgi:hypothetical protein